MVNGEESSDCYFESEMGKFLYFMLRNNCQNIYLIFDIYQVWYKAKLERNYREEDYVIPVFRMWRACFDNQDLKS